MINDDKQLCSRKSNDIIQNYYWNFSKAELKLFEYVCCCVGTYHYDKDKNIITTSFQELQKEMNNVNLLDGGNQYAKIKKTMQNLRDKSAIVESNGDGETVAVCDKVKWLKNGCVMLMMSDDFKKFATNLDKRKGYTFTELQIVNSMSSKYTIQLYYLLQSWQGKNELTFDIDYLRKKLQVPESSYKNVGKFKQILEKIIEEYTDIMKRYEKINNHISYEMVKRGKKYVGVKLMLHNSVGLEDISWNCKYKDKPNTIVFDTEEDKEQYTEYWLLHNYKSNEIEKYEILYSCVPENVHNYNKAKIDAVYNVAFEYANTLVVDAYLPDVLFKCETIINRFNMRKWFTNYSQKVEKDIFAYYIKCFEKWLEQQRSSAHSYYTSPQKTKPNPDLERIEHDAMYNTDIDGI